MAEVKKVGEAKEDKRTFAQRLAYVQKVLKAPKSRWNKFGEYYYRSLEDIFEGVKELCEENGLLLVMSDKPIMEGDWHYIEATARLYDTNRFPEVFIETTGHARETQEKKKSDAAQITGAASSYAKKYALNGLFLIDDTKDPDTDEYTRQNREYDSQGKNNTTSKSNAGTDASYGAKTEIVQKKYAEALSKVLDNHESIRQWAYDHYKIDNLYKLTKAQYNELVTMVKNNEAKS